MKADKQKRLEARGWRVGTVQEFIGLSDEELLFIELRLALGRALKQRRIKLTWSQKKLARHIKSSQSRVAKMESADPTVSFELLFRGLLATGAMPSDIVSVIKTGGASFQEQLAAAAAERR
jgi:hypothetical protein